MCDPNDQNCVQECFTNATAAAQSEYQAIVTCAQSSGCAENDNACLNMVCASEIQACLGGGGGAPGGAGGAYMGSYDSDGYPGEAGTSYYNNELIGSEPTQSINSGNGSITIVWLSE